MGRGRRIRDSGDGGGAVAVLAPQDATMYWLSARTRNDLFLLFAFADTGVPTARLRARVAERCSRIPDLTVRMREVPGDLAYPFWTPCAFRSDQFVEHTPSQPNWDAVQDLLGELLDTGVVATRRPWRLHVVRGIEGAPGFAGESATVAILQISHALADGRRATRIARELFAGDETRTRSVESLRRARANPWTRALLGALRTPALVVATARRGVAAHRAQRELIARTDAGEIPAPAAGFTPGPLNSATSEQVSGHAVRMIVLDMPRGSGRTVTVVVLTAVSVALADYLTARGETAPRLGAQVPVAGPGEGKAHNDYRSVGVDLYIDEPDLAVRAERIAADLAARRVRAAHPLLAAQDRVTAVTPAFLLRRDVARFPLGTPATISGHTVVSSVDRGPADLDFGGPVRFTAGFPAIGSVMRLTHGVHGLGDTVTISVHADPAVLTDIDGYTALLRAALVRVSGLPPRP